jgi:hypothetical protein
MRKNQRTGGFILDGRSVVTDIQRETGTPRIWNKRGPASVWMDASTFNGGAGNPPNHPAPPVPTARAELRDGVKKVAMEG